MRKHTEKGMSTVWDLPESTESTIFSASEPLNKSSTTVRRLWNDTITIQSVGAVRLSGLILGSSIGHIRLLTEFPFGTSTTLK